MSRHSESSDSTSIVEEIGSADELPDLHYELVNQDQNVGIQPYMFEPIAEAADIPQTVVPATAGAGIAEDSRLNDTLWYVNNN
jgi:hypothetical protein